MKELYSRIQIPKERQIGDISELFLISSHDLDEFVRGHKLDPNFKPVEKRIGRKSGIKDKLDLYVEYALELQANLAVIDERLGLHLHYMRCKEKKIQGSSVPGVGVGAVVVNAKEELYLIKRGPRCGNRNGKWENPGGTQDFGESLAEAAERETLEESGKYVKAFGIVSVSEEFVEGQHWNNFGILCRWYGKEMKDRVPEEGKVIDEGWFDPEKLPEPMSEGALAVIKDYLTGVQIPINRVNK